MTTKDEALQMALDALEAVEQTDTPYFSMVRTAIAACLEALAQKDEQERVAAAAKAEEREACAAMVKPLDESLAEAIRARGKTHDKR